MLFQVLFLIRRAISSLARTFEQGRREGGTRGTHVPSEIVTLKKILFEQHGICDSHSNFQHTFGVSGGFVPDPTRGSVPVRK